MYVALRPWERGYRTGPDLSEMKLGIKDHPLPSRPIAVDTSKLTPDASSSSSLLIQPAAASERTKSSISGFSIIVSIVEEYDRSLRC